MTEDYTHAARNWCKDYRTLILFLLIASAYSFGLYGLIFTKYPAVLLWKFHDIFVCCRIWPNDSLLYLSSFHEQRPGWQAEHFFKNVKFL